MRTPILALTLAAVALPALPALAQPGQGYGPPGQRDRYDRDDRGRGDDGRDYRDGQRDGRRDDRHDDRGPGRGPGGPGYAGRGDDRGRDYRNYDWNRREPGQRGYFAERYYRTGGNYRPYRVTRQTRIYRGGNGNYYCRRDDGTTGLIVGAALGGLLGNQVGYGDSRVLATLIGGGGGALLGRAIDRGQVSCR